MNRKTVAVATALLCFSSIARGQTPPWLDPQNPHLQARDAMVDHLSAKYRVESAEVRTFRRESGMATRSLSAGGDLTPKAPVVPEAGDDGRARALARAFLDDEAAALFNVAPADIRVERVGKGSRGDVTQTIINHRVYVGDVPLRDARVQVELDGDEHIRRVNADLPPIPQAMRQAARRPSLDEQAARRIAQADIEASAKSPNAPYPVKRYMTDISRRPTEIEKVMVAAPPYVVWEVRSIWRYDIDAFTGAILSRTPGWADAR